MKRLLTALAVFTLLGTSTALAETTTPCPAGYACVKYQKDTFAIDPADGFYQAIVVEERESTVKDLDGTHATHTVKLAAFTANGDGYVLTGEYVVDRSGQFANAALRDTFGLTELK